MKMSRLILAIICLALGFVDANNIIEDVSKFINKFEQANYNKNIRPNYGSDPVDINITMFIKDISSISEVTMDYTIDFVIRHKWNDKRLAFDATEAKTNQLTLGQDFADKIWIPDTFFVNAKQVNSHATTSTDSVVLLRIQPNGDILHATRFLVTASCPMDLRHFPMDSQVCHLEFTSSGYTRKEVDYHWSHGNNALTFKKPLNLPNFILRGERRRKIYMDIADEGNFAQLELDLLFTRSKGFYIYQIYIPASLIVFISWAPFWMDRNSGGTRVFITVTTVMTITTLITSTNESLPKISYVKAIDIYLFFCFVMVFTSLLESSLAEYWERCHRKINKKCKRCNLRDGTRLTHAHLASYIDKLARISFPIIYLAFNLFYWVIYLLLSHYNPVNFNPI